MVHAFWSWNWSKGRRSKRECNAVLFPLMLTFAKHICEALEAAHEKGIVHRDLEPGDVKITPQGQVKVLDFGLAKALDSAPANPALSNSPTLSMAATNPGIILGTAAYMSPEQAKGRVVDRRADIFAFGCALRNVDRPDSIRWRRCDGDPGTCRNSGAGLEPLAGRNAGGDS